MANEMKMEWYTTLTYKIMMGESNGKRPPTLQRTWNHASIRGLLGCDTM